MQVSARDTASTLDVRVKSVWKVLAVPYVAIGAPWRPPFSKVRATDSAVDAGRDEDFWKGLGAALASTPETTNYTYGAPPWKTHTIFAELVLVPMTSTEVVHPNSVRSS